ncbi:MAG: hypothetical protein Q8N99_02270 [Nanoarchaeota archaeon]|nr:hypothetical protein [Nanoarchaeota archaeon]
MTKITTIKITSETRERLNKLKEYERETFNEVINKIFYVLNTLKKNPEKAQRVLLNIDRRIKRKDIINKKIKSRK